MLENLYSELSYFYLSHICVKPDNLFMHIENSSIFSSLVEVPVDILKLRKYFLLFENCLDFNIKTIYFSFYAEYENYFLHNIKEFNQYVGLKTYSFIGYLYNQMNNQKYDVIILQLYLQQSSPETFLTKVLFSYSVSLLLFKNNRRSNT